MAHMEEQDFSRHSVDESPNGSWSWLETMNYVGQLAGQVFVQVKELYRGLNPATLSGCIDVIVVRQPDGSLQCSPFHVRFGKMGVLRSREKVVDIEINGEPVSLHMKLGENGEAFFVKETENKLEVVPSYLVTSPIVSKGEELMESQLGRGNSRHHDTIPCSSLPVQNLGQSDGVMTKKRRKRRRKARPEGGGGGAGGRREESGEEFSEDEDMFTIDLSSDEEREGDSSRPVYSDQGSTVNNHIHPSTDWTHSQSRLIKETLSIHQPGGLSISCPQQTSHFSPLISSPDDSQSSTPKSDSELTNQSKENPEILWTWGELPQAAQPSFLTSHQKDSAAAVSIPVSASTHFRAINDTGTPRGPVPPLDKDTEENRNGHIVREQGREVESVGPSCVQMESLTTCSVSQRILPDHLEESRNRGSSIRRTDSPSKRKEKRSQHLGADGIYLDDITALEPEDQAENSITMAPVNRLKDESSSSDEDHRSSDQVSGASQSDPLESSGGICYKKTLRLTSEQLASLQLKEGPNDVVFSVTTQYQGTCRCHGTIYLWSWDDKIVISDIDGTITRSDTLGHILPTLGKDWTHQGIARLYHRVSLNGYKFMYCSARAIGMADMTRGYLHWVNERGTMLPMGPVLLSPSSLFSALHREVIEKKPEKFKIECLTDIKHLFYPNTEPFYAAFGNRATDVYSYKEVGVPLNRIFTVNPKGELVQEHAKTNISSYGLLCDTVDHVFPVLIQDEEADFAHSDPFDQCSYWNNELPEGISQGEEDLQPIETS
ncbi:phosphatidate phosphatase LPIN1-like isoform X3 [Archocentrus centrarchus]|uniref:phosphatidate phosphatase LPIN1-like isoform X3 n=1 Tax=Archocentrus centrarchus TaxID=63155 RepID=UPI0011EA25F4|nr:phosphatidate phosphatase LPIN1-like isoform X3 [Archocentrus centrarchus]